MAENHLLECLNNYEVNVKDIRAITVDFESQIELKKVDYRCL